jgi:hypothetical protein
VKRIVWAAVLLFASVAAHAQELDVFDLSDFVDPRLHGAVFDEQGRIVDPGQTYAVLRTTTGAIANYTWRNLPSDGEIGFLHLAKSTYKGANQRTLKLTAIGSDGSLDLPRIRATAQFGRYHVTPPSPRMVRSGIDEPMAGRWMLSAMVESLRGGGSSYDAEISGSLDVITPLPGKRSTTGSVVFVSRKNDEGGWTHRTAYVYRLVNRTYFDDRVTVGATVAAGAERTDSWHWATIRLSTRTSIEAGWLGRVNFVWTPTYLPIEQSRRLHHEVGFFIDRTLKVWLPRK